MGGDGVEDFDEFDSLFVFHVAKVGGFDERTGYFVEEAHLET